MEYWELRKKFVEVSGRFDLIDATTWEDNGADFFINAGQRYLDRLLDNGKMQARYPVIVPAGTIIAYTVGIRAIKEVWAANSTGSKWQLFPKSINDMRAGFPTDSGLLDRGDPLYYAPGKFRPYPDELVSVAGMNDVEDLLISGTHYTYNGIVLMPPPASDLTLTIWGLFYSPALSATLNGAVWTQTKSYWSEVEPDTLLSAALAKVSSFYGDPTRGKEYRELALENVRGIDFDHVDEHLVGDMEMG